MSYKPSSVIVTVLDNPRIINIGDTARIPAVVGLGPTTRTVFDEAVVRGTGSVDYLSNFLNSTSGTVVTQVSSIPGIRGGLGAVLVSQNGSLFNQASASVGEKGTIAWPQVAPGTSQDLPVTGSVYYVSYSYNTPVAQLAPFMFSDKDQIKLRYGAQDNSDSILTVAGLVALENNAPAVWLCQASGSAAQIATTYKDAIDLFRTKNNIEQLICVFPSGSVTRTVQESILTYMISHVAWCNAYKKERGILYGSPSPYFASSGGIDSLASIGDNATPGTMVYVASTLKNRDICYVVPTRIQRYDDDGNLIELDGNFGAVAVAAVQSAQKHRADPIHGFTVAGLVIQDEMWNPEQMNTLGAGNCLVLESRNGVVTIRDAITTDSTSANTAELSVVASSRLVKRTLRDGLANIYTNKGKVITPTITADVTASTRGILQGLVNEGELFDFGHKDDPATGELIITAQQNPIEPRQIDVTAAIKYLYPLKWVNVTVSTYV